MQFKRLIVVGTASSPKEILLTQIPTTPRPDTLPVQVSQYVPLPVMQNTHSQVSQHNTSLRLRIPHLLFFLFIVIQSTIILMQKNGPFFDEAIYVTAGFRALQGKGLDDGYLIWFAGSLLWPLMAALSYLVHGLLAVRFLALGLAFLTLLTSYLTTKNLFGEKASCFTLLAFIASGPFMALSHLGVYDSPALAFTSISLWSITQLKHNHRIWLCISAVSFAFAVIAKYPIGLMLIPLLALLIHYRKEKSLGDVCLFLFIFTAVFLAFFLSCQYQVGDWFSWSSQNKPTFGSTRTVIIFAQIYFGLIPFVIAVVGFLLSKRKNMTIILLLTGLIWPLYHIISGNPVSDNKHVVFGFLFTYPLIGLFFARLWEKKIFYKAVALLTIISLLLIGSLQLYRLDLAWPDVRQPAAFLVQNTHYGDKLLINDSWSYNMYLYANHKIATPWDVFDGYRITNNESKIDLCSYNWFVNEEGSYAWPESVLAKIKTCKNFVAVFHYSSQVIGLGSNFQFVTYTVKTTIWKNTKMRGDTSQNTDPSFPYVNNQLLSKKEKCLRCEITK